MTVSFDGIKAGDRVDGYRRAMDDVAATIEAALAEEGKP